MQAFTLTSAIYLLCSVLDYYCRISLGAEQTASLQGDVAKAHDSAEMPVGRAVSGTAGQ